MNAWFPLLLKAVQDIQNKIHMKQNAKIFSFQNFWCWRSNSPKIIFLSCENCFTNARRSHILLNCWSDQNKDIFSIYFDSMMNLNIGTFSVKNILLFFISISMLAGFIDFIFSYKFIIWKRNIWLIFTRSSPPLEICRWFP